MVTTPSFPTKKFLNSAFILLLLSSCSSCQNKPGHPDSSQYPLGYPTPVNSALQQLKNFPAPRYYPDNHLQRLFNWMNPYYMAGLGQPKDPTTIPEKGKGKKNNIKTFSMNDINDNSVNIQEELALEWNYGINIPHSGILPPKDTNKSSFIKLANKYPNIPLDVITFWTQLRPSQIGIAGNVPMIRRKDLDSSLYINFNFYGTNTREIKYNFPDSLIKIDGAIEAFDLSKILKVLTRPINRINENGEEPPGAYLRENQLADDPEMVHMKDSMKIDSWADFAAIRKLEMRTTYSDCFMKSLPELKNTQYSVYTVEGGPIDRFEWTIMKKCMTPLNGIYYSTPDFYPRWPKNWKDWAGAWHGWKWIAIGRRNEIKDGDYLFSPFVAAGWSNKNEENITPGQWLGLLKCLSVIGAEFYYVGYFNLSPPFNNPALYTWQAAMPAYAQAITSRFEDVLRNGNVLFNSNGEPIISYPTDDRHVLVTARKHNKKQEYVICGTYQPFSNDSDEIPVKTNVSVTIDGHPLSFEIRRQGSVYIYEKTEDNRDIFYQLDSWHENAHPDRWSKDFYFEAEVADSGLEDKDIYTSSAGNAGDYTNFVSYIHPEIKKAYGYNFTVKDTLAQTYFLWLRYRNSGAIQFTLSKPTGSVKLKPANFNESKDWKWLKVEFPSSYNSTGNNMLIMEETKGDIDIDKFVITTKSNVPK